MCGFFATTHRSPTTDFSDVSSRGWATQEFSHGKYLAVQSQLPCYNGRGDFSYYETDDFIFSFTGEIYNTPSKYNTDTEYMLQCVLNDKYTHLNGQWAFALYNKHTQRVRVGRDPLGQIPLFVSTTDGITVCNTLPSIVRTLEAVLDPATLVRWYSSKHYTSLQTCWQGIHTVPAGTITDYNSDGDTVRVQRVLRQWHTTPQILQHTLADMRETYSTALPSASIASGGIDSTLVADTFCTRENYAINHIGKDWVSNTVEELDINVFVMNVDLAEWRENLVQLIQETYTIPYSWSWVGYYIIGAHCPESVLYTGEGADEIFGGYPGYGNGGTPYSTNPEHDALRAEYYSAHTPVVANKLLDQSVFVPVSTTGANLALGCHAVEPRNPYLDHAIANNTLYLPQTHKPELTELFRSRWGEPKPKQGFGGWPDQVFTNADWKTGAWNLLEDIV